MSSTYWQNKATAYLQESVVKVFDIENRDKWAEMIQQSVGSLSANADKTKIQQAAYIASGLTRAALPSDASKLDEIILNHPLVNDSSITFCIKDKNVESLVSEIKAMLENDLAYLTKGMSEDEKTEVIFYYLFFAFNKQLRKNNIGNLGALWDILPADTRMPDHPMWHHFGMTSAIYSALEKNTDAKKENLSLVVYSITPVQEFIGKARKLRDYWTGSVLLSYLAFCGITAVMNELGPDHILYPSLQNQALVEQWIGMKYPGMKEFLAETDSTLAALNNASKGIAAFPNKFVFLCNNADVENVCRLIEKAIDDAWKNTTGIVKDYIAGLTGSKDSKAFNESWDNAINKYWKYSWAATDFATIQNEEQLKALLSEKKWKTELATMKKFDEFFKNDDLYPDYEASNLYGTTHSLAQGLLAAGKMKPTSYRHIQYGEKCPLCGELSVLNNKQGDSKEFWKTLREKANPKGKALTIGENERLCAVCAVKRFLPLGSVLKEKKHILYETLVNTYKDGNFPSTTEMSAWEFLNSGAVDANKKAAIIDRLHSYEFDADDEKLKTILENAKDFETRYYAFLLMDGDKMGDLINGETTEATWNDVINITDISKSPFADKDFAKQRRTINPALHSMISDSLNNFARYGVQPLVDMSGGKLIYAGGDDVCAILPLSKAFETADRIRQVYQLSYGQVTKDGSVLLDEPSPDKSKIVMHLGHSKNQDATKISLSGAIIIAHHKQPLKEVIQTAHSVLDGVAKEKSGRNSLAIRLMKRSGGDRDVWFKWEEKNFFAESKTCRESFLEIIDQAGSKLTPSLLYNIENLKGSFEPLVKDIEKNRELIVKLFEYEVAHSIFSRKEDASKAEELARNLAGVCIKIKKKDGKYVSAENWYNPEAAIIANFLSKSGLKPEKKGGAQ